MSRTGLGVALSASELFVSQPGGDRSAGTRIALASGLNERGTWPELAAALRQLAPAGGVGELSVALLPPLVEVAGLEMPPLDDSELMQVLARNAGKYFVSARGSQTVGVVQRRGRRGQASSVLAAAASTRMIAAIDAAAAESGWQVTAVAPAEGAWAAAAVALWPAFARRTAHLLVHETDRTVLLELDRGRVAAVRRFRAGAADADLIADAILAVRGSDTSAVGAVGVVTGRQELLRALGARGVGVNTAAGPRAEFADVPEMLAAAFATASTGPLLMNEQARAARRSELRRATMMVAAVAVLLVGIAAAVGLWGVRRELRSIQDQRAEMKPLVAATLVGRSSVEDAYRHLSAVAAADRAAPHWAPVLAELSAIVPDDGYLIAFRTRGDSLVVEGMAARAVRVFDAIRASKLLSNVRVPAPVRAEAPEGGDPLERFSISAVLKGAAPPVSPPIAKPAPKTSGAQ